MLKQTQHRYRMKLEISKLAEKKVNESLLITGSARSGTTILGKIIHSFERVEYAFEPPTLYSLFPLIENISEQQWRLLFETYLYEDFFLNAISGRNINCNLVDDSSIYKIKSSQEIESRLTQSLGKVQAEEIGTDKILAYKMPDVVPYIPKLQHYYPNMQFIIIKREAVGTINSLLAKKWFSNDAIKKNVVWPFRCHNGFQIPSWVKEDDDEWWAKMPELDRCAYYYIRVNEDVDKIKNRIEISYEQLLSDPLRVARDFATALNLEFGEKTQEIIEQVKPTVKKRDSEIVRKISTKLKEKVLFYSKQS